MTRLHSYFTTVQIFLLPLAAVSIILIILTSVPGTPWYIVFFALPVFAMSGYLLYSRKQVFYEHGQLYIGNLFSSTLNVVRKDRFGSIDPAYRIGAYKITYYDDDNNVKYVRFNLNIFLSDGREIIDKLNEIN